MKGEFDKYQRNTGKIQLAVNDLQISTYMSFYYM